MKDSAMKYRHGCRPRGAAGFTLIELMVTVAIAAILLSIVVPTYQAQVRKSRRTEAKTAILDFAAREERLYATQNAYSTDPVALGYTAAGGSWPVSTGTYYQIEAPTSSAPTATTPGTFSVTVDPAPASPQLSDTTCASFTVTQTGAQSATGTNPSACWP
ncbi:MAG TPA: type IV pilin protein [Steroidobacteraceae bacterium]|nr:type IV pilin protein [Steroidobacteraceae bacterium]